MPGAWALEEELEHQPEGAQACYAVYKDPPVLVPTVKASDGKVDEGMTRVMRWTPLRAARALHRLELDFPCLPYAGGEYVRSHYLAFVSSATDAGQTDAREFAARNVSWSVDWEKLPLSELEKSMAGFTLKPGPFAQTCRVPTIPTSVFVPAAGQAAGDVEKEAFELLGKNARALQKSQSEITADFASLLEALEGRGCADLTHEFFYMVSNQRWAFFEYRDQVLGRLMRGKLRWEPLPAAP
jgi:hypothetical protein